ncbi:hypothetical protein HYU93_02525 [Candidatus Daviesbacteria bacterium]|nr:hypothetical protein [Candidatus Daviesbacteria bacterium]
MTPEAKPSLLQVIQASKLIIIELCNGHLDGNNFAAEVQMRGLPTFIGKGTHE